MFDGMGGYEMTLGCICVDLCDGYVGDLSFPATAGPGDVTRSHF